VSELFIKYKADVCYCFILKKKLISNCKKSIRVDQAHQKPKTKTLFRYSIEKSQLREIQILD